jgi:hypothetical protein
MNPTMPIMQPGDIITFSGTGFLSKSIQIVSHSILTHMGMVLPPDVLVDGRPQTETQIIESTIEDGHSGPQINPLRLRLASYAKERGRAYRLSLADNIRAFLDWKILWDLAARKLHGDSYNKLELGQYVLRDLPFISYLPQLREANAHEEVCSEFLAELLRAGGLPGLNPPLLSPGIVASLRIYKSVEQLLGAPAIIRGFNTY